MIQSSPQTGSYVGAPVRRKKLPRRLSICLVVVILLIISSTIVWWELPVFHERPSCALGQAVFRGAYWGPDMIMNRPYLGNATGTFSANGTYYTFASGGLKVNTTVGSWWSPSPDTLISLSTGGTHWVGLNNVQDNWTVYSVRNTTSVQGGGHCTSRFVAIPDRFSVATRVAFTSIPLVNNSTDTGEKRCVGTPLCVSFDNNFHGSNYPSVDTCGRGPITINVSQPVSIPISLTFPYQGSNATTNGTLSWGTIAVPNPIVPSMSYSFPADTGTWELYSPAGPAIPGAFAFQYFPC